jgi:predicted acylesterase/phospholipase RssA
MIGRRRRKPRIGLALAAGGAKGVAYVPFIRAIEEAGLEISAVASDYWRREPVVFESGSLVDAIRASTAVPVVEMLDFHKYREVFETVGSEVDRFLEELDEHLPRGRRGG